MISILSYESSINLLIGAMFCSPSKQKGENSHTHILRGGFQVVVTEIQIRDGLVRRQRATKLGLDLLGGVTYEV